MSSPAKIQIQQPHHMSPLVKNLIIILVCIFLFSAGKSKCDKAKRENKPAPGYCDIVMAVDNAVKAVGTFFQNWLIFLALYLAFVVAAALYRLKLRKQEPDPSKKDEALEKAKETTEETEEELENDLEEVEDSFEDFYGGEGEGGSKDLYPDSDDMGPSSDPGSSSGESGGCFEPGEGGGGVEPGEPEPGGGVEGAMIFGNLRRRNMRYKYTSNARAQ